jgi:peptide/nickel transport system permease protein
MESSKANQGAFTVPVRTRKKGSSALRSLRKNRPALIAAVYLVALILCAVFANLVAPNDPGTMGRLNIVDRLKPPAVISHGTSTFVLGTDTMGRDILSRIIFGARVSMMIGVAAVLAAGTVGVLLGLLGGYFGGWLDAVFMRLADIQLALPSIILAIFLMTIIGAGVWNVIVVLALSAWVQYARVVRGQVLSLRAKEFVDAARVIGAPGRRIIFRHILPNVWAPVIIVASFSVAGAILSEAALSFLGVGVDPATPTWGQMLSDGKAYLADAWWLAAFPGLALMITVLAINLLGDWLRDYLDPRLLKA